MADITTACAWMVTQDHGGSFDRNDVGEKPNRKMCGEATSQYSAQFQHYGMEPSTSPSIQTSNDDIRDSFEDSFVNSYLRSPRGEASRKTDLNQYTVGWISALPLEYAAALLMLDEQYGQPISDHIASGDDNVYELGRIGSHNIVLAPPHRGEYGTMSTVTVVTNMRRSFPNIRLGLMVGIGGSAPTKHNDIRLGDVVVSSPDDGKRNVIQYDGDGYNFKHTGRPGRGFLSQHSISASKEQGSMMQNRLPAHEHHNETEEQYIQLAHYQTGLLTVNPKYGTTVRHLSLDGGGIRGLTLLRILQRMMEHDDLEVSSDWTELCEIGGTSTGGLIAIMLGRLGNSITSMSDKPPTHKKNLWADMGHYLKLISPECKVQQRSCRISSRPFDDLVDTRISNAGSDYIGSHFHRIMPDFVFQDKFMHEFMFQDDFMPDFKLQDDFVPELMLLDDSKPDFMFLDDVMPKNQTVWLTRIYEANRRFWSIDNPGTGSKIFPSTWLDILRTTASRRQRHIMTLLSHENKDWFDLEHGTIPGDKENRTCMTALEYAARAGHESLIFLLLSSTSATVTTSWNNENNKTVVRSGYRNTEIGIRKIFGPPTLNPSLTEFVVALTAYSIAVVVYTQRHRGDCWQDQIILFALSTSTLLGLGLGYDLQTTVLSIVSWAVIAALMLSSVSHGLARRASKSNRVPYEQGGR